MKRQYCFWLLLVFFVLTVVELAVVFFFVDAGLREKLNKIMSSEYFTTTPEMKAPVEVAAAAAGNYGSFQVPVHGSVVPVEMEGSDSQPQEKV